MKLESSQLSLVSVENELITEQDQIRNINCWPQYKINHPDKPLIVSPNAEIKIENLKEGRHGNKILIVDD